MAKESKGEKPKDPAGREQYADVVARLREVVESLEGGELSLEASMEKFAEGVQLVKRGEKLLAEAEKRIEQLLGEEGPVAPLDVSEPGAPAAPKGARKGPARAADDDEGDVPF